MRAGSSVRAASAQTGHWRSRNSVTVTGAERAPRTPWRSGMPATNDAAAGVGLVVGGGLAPEADRAMMAASATAATTVGMSRRVGMRFLSLEALDGPGAGGRGLERGEDYACGGPRPRPGAMAARGA